MEQLIIQSKVLHSAVQSRQIEIHGAVYDLDSGKVTHLGRHPRERDFIRQPTRKLIRTASEPALPADDALIKLRDGNQRFVRGEVERMCWTGIFVESWCRKARGLLLPSWAVQTLGFP